MKFGLALEGGAIRTIFSSGACDGLLELGLMADHVVGVSAGIAYGVSYVSRQKGRNLEILEKYVNDDRYMGTSHALNPLNDCYFNLDFIYDEIPNHLVPFDYDTFLSYSGTVEAVCTNLNTGKADYLDAQEDGPGFPLLRATCSLPMMFPIVEVNGQPYLDGGVAAPIPHRRLLDAGCDKVIVVLTRERDYVKKQEKALKVAIQKYHKYPHFCDALRRRAEVYNEAREDVFRLEKEGRVLVVTPYSTTGFSRMERNVEKIRALYQSGYDQVLARQAEIRRYLEG
jgi:predicted patatin/cPLA2 family phospholipase